MSDQNLVIDALTALPKLINEGIRLIKEGEANRKKFFDDKVSPIHDAARILYDAHIETLKKALDHSRDENFNELNRLVDNAVLFEQGNTDKLHVAIKASESAKVKGQLGELYAYYIDCVGKILIPRHEQEGTEEFEKYRMTRMCIRIYDRLEKLKDFGIATPDNIQSVVKILSVWNKRVLMGYQDLYDYCKS